MTLRAAALASFLALGGCSVRAPTGGAAGPSGSLYAPPSAPFDLVAANPPEGATAVPRRTSVTLTFDSPPDPESVDFPSVTLSSGLLAFDAIYAVDLLARSIVVTPRSPLAASTRYVVHVTSDVRSLDGAPLRAPASVGFTTSDELGAASPPPTPRTLAGDVLPLFYDLCTSARGDGASPFCTCAQGGCHAPPTPAAGLDLTPASAAAALVAPSTERPLYRVHPGDPASSYLLRKLLGTPDIDGERMPPGGPPLDDASLRIISDWIATGAK